MSETATVQRTPTSAAHADPRPLRGGQHALGDSPLLRRCSAEQAAWARALAGGVVLGTAPNPGAAGAAVEAVALRRIEPSCWRDADAWPALEVELGGQAATVRLAPHSRWEELGQPAFAALPNGLRLSIAAHLTHGLRWQLGRALHAVGLAASTDAPALLGLSASLSPSMSATAVTPPTPATPSLMIEMRVQFTSTGVTTAPAPWCVRVHLPQRLPAPPKAAARAAAAPLRRQLRLRPQLVLGHAWLPSSLLSSRPASRLQPGSVLLLDRVGSETGPLQALLVIEGTPLAVLEVGGWQLPSLNAAPPIKDSDEPAAVSALITRWASADEATPPGPAPHPLPTPRSDSMQSPDSPTLEATEASAGRANLSQAKVPVQAVIELPAVRLAELERWAPGTIIDSSLPVDGGQITLRVGGQAVGRGRIVAVGTLLGFELLELFN